MNAVEANSLLFIVVLKAYSRLLLINSSMMESKFGILSGSSADTFAEKTRYMRSEITWNISFLRFRDVLNSHIGSRPI